MNKRILSLLLACLMLALAVPVFTLPTLAEDSTNSYVYESAFLNNRPTPIENTEDATETVPIVYRGGWDYITYSSLALEGAAPLSDRIVVSGPALGFAVAGETSVNNGKPFVNASANKSGWPTYGMGVYKNTVIGTRYTAEKGGVIDISVDRILNHTIKPDSTLVLGYAIYVGGEKIWPADADWHEVTYYGANITEKTAAVQGILGEDADNVGNINDEIPTGITVKKGETVEFLIAGISHHNPVNVPANPAYWNFYITHDNFFDGRVSYTSVNESAFLDNRPTPIENTEDATETVPIVYRGGWDYITYSSLALEGAAPLSDRIVVSGPALGFAVAGETSVNNGKPFVNASANKSGWPTYGMGVYKNTVIGTRYTAPNSGMIDVSVDRILNHTIKPDSTLVLGYAIYVGGEKIWPADADWHEVTYYGANITEKTAAVQGILGEDADNVGNINDEIPTGILVEAGDTVEFLIAGISHHNPVNVPANPAYWNFYITHDNFFDGRVAYTEVFDMPTLFAAPSIGDTLGITFSASADEGHETGVVFADGTPATAITVAPADADKEYTVKPYIKLNAETTIYGEEKTVSFNSLLAAYTGENADAAAAALAYTAAFRAFFAEGNAITAPTFTGTYNTQVTAHDYTGDNEVAIASLSLLVNDKINIKMVTEALPAGAKVQVASDAAFTAILNAGNDAPAATADGLGSKYIMEGVSLANWNTLYYLRVVDAEGNVISDTVQYSVSTYCARMCDTDDAKLTSLVSSMLALYEACYA